MTRTLYAPVTNVAASTRFQSTDSREYFDAIFTSPEPDSYFRIVSADSMPQIAADASEGRRLLDSHKHDTNGIGQTVFGEVIQTARGEITVPQVFGTAYILKGLALDGQTYQSTDDWAAVVRDGMANSLSIGFRPKRQLCNLDGFPIYSYKCRHYPGEYYDITDPETGETENKLCTFTCFGSRLVEVSFVYHGANPDARLVQKAKALLDRNLLEPHQVQAIENRLNVAILDTPRSYFDMALNTDDKKEVMEIVKKAVAEAMTAAAPTPPPPLSPAPTPAGKITLTDANGKIIGQVDPHEVPASLRQPTAADISKAVADAIAPIGDRIGAIETALHSGDPMDTRAKAIDAWKKQFKRVFSKEPTEEQIAALEAYPNVDAIQIVTDGLKTTADERFHAGQRTGGLGDELENGRSDHEPPAKTLEQIRAENP